MVPTREQAFEILKQYNNEESHIHHAHAVEAAMRHFAELYHEDPDLWGVVGILHDIDWEETTQTPEKHCHIAPEILREAGVDEDIIHAVQSHGYGICTDIEPVSQLEKTLFTIDELTGLIITAGLVRPSKSLGDLELKSVKKKWKDIFHIFAVDGSRISIPNSKSNFENYGEMFSKQNPNRRWSMALCSTIYDVCNDIIVHGLLKRYLGSERDAALQHCAELEKLDLFKDAVIIFDRGYFSDAMFRYFADKGYLCVMRIREGFNLAKQCTGDCILTLPGDKKKGTEDINVRIIAIPLDGGETEYLATSIFDESLTAEDFKELYFMRWPIELKYGELKNQCLMEEFSGATSTSIEQEFFINLLLSNLASLVKCAADDHIKENANPNNKYRYQANRAYIIGRMKWFLARFIANVCGLSLLDDIFEGACANRSQIQPGRKSPRNKRAHARERKHFNNRKQVI